MAIAKVEDIVFTSKDKYTGSDDKQYPRYTTIGAVFTDDEGRQSIKLEFIPTDIQSGYMNIFEKKKK